MSVNQPFNKTTGGGVGWTLPSPQHHFTPILKIICTKKFAGHYYDNKNSASVCVLCGWATLIIDVYWGEV